MAFHIKAKQQKFIFTLANDLPVGEVEKWGSGLYLLCCPLCGRLHNLNASIKLDLAGAAHEPVCISKPINQPAIAAWIKQYPEAANHTTVFLKLRQPLVIPQEVEAPALAVRKAA